MLIGLSSFDVGSQGLAEDEKAGREGGRKGHMLNEDDPGSDPA